MRRSAEENAPQSLHRLQSIPTWGWAVATVAGALLRFDYRVGDASLANAVMLLAAVVLEPRRAARSQALALPVLLALSLPGPAGGPGDWGYMVGRVVAAGVISRLVRSGPAEPQRRAVLLPLAAYVLGATVASLAWSGAADPRLHLRTYYVAVLALALVIAFYYSLRLIARPGRIPVLMAGLWPYYGLGIGWALLVATGVLGAPAGLPESSVDTLFHGLVTHLPGDALTCVVIAFLLDPRPAILGRESR